MNYFFSHFTSSLSFRTLLLLCSLILVFRLCNISEKETSWDVLGYYLPLPATFIYEDPLMENREWIQQVNEERQLTDTLYQLSSTPDGRPMYFFLLGMAMLFLPFFLLGHGCAFVLDYPMDGFSMPYQVAMVVGGLLYTFVGLYFLRKILLHFFPEKLSSIVLLILVLATNYSHHLTLKNLETVNVLFLFVSILIWNTIQWHKNQRLVNLMGIGISITFMSLVKPSEILIVLLPLFYGVYNKATLKEKLKLINQHKNQFFWTILICILIASPQMSYWYVKTGSLFYDSYINPGVGLDVFSPYVIDSLFSFKKGWFVYTPVMLLSVIGFYFFLKKRREIALSFFLYFIFTSYIIFSWTEWWYGAAFSNRPLITVYPILAVSLGFFLQFLGTKSTAIKVFFTLFISAATLLNQFQWWQLRNGILDPYRMTKEYYLATFLKTSVTEEDRALLSVYRNFDGQHEFTQKEQYNLIATFPIASTTASAGFTLNPTKEFSPTFEKSFETLTNKDHIWVEVLVRYKNQEIDPHNLPLVVTHMNRKEGAYGYASSRLAVDNDAATNVIEHKSYYMTPHIRNGKDGLKIYLWNKEKIDIEIQQMVVKIYEHK